MRCVVVVTLLFSQMLVKCMGSVFYASFTRRNTKSLHVVKGHWRLMEKDELSFGDFKFIGSAHAFLVIAS